MREGWHEDDYLILFDEAEVSAVSDRYAISQSFPGYQIVGLRGWDDFIVRDSASHTYSVPTIVPERPQLPRFVIPDSRTVLQPDERFTGKIKWYVKPIVFGGSPDLGENMVWVTHEQHAQLVRWWNEKCRQLRAYTSAIRSFQKIPGRTAGTRSA